MSEAGDRAGEGAIEVGMRRILVAIDDSPRAPAVLAEASMLARATGAKLRLFRCVPIQPEIPWDMVSRFPRGGLEELLTERGKSELEARGRALPAGQFDGVATAVGTPWSTICAAAKAFDADLIVLGSHGYSGIDHVLGTTAAKVVNHADRSVMVVRARRA